MDANNGNNTENPIYSTVTLRAYLKKNVHTLKTQVSV